MADLIKPNGKVTKVTPASPPNWTEKELQSAVGGYFELLFLPGSRILVVNEDGVPLRLPRNAAASGIAGMPIVGPALLIPDSERIP